MDLTKLLAGLESLLAGVPGDATPVVGPSRLSHDLSWLLSYDLRWLLTAAVLLGPALFVATCRHALEVCSRKSLLERASAGQTEKVERFLSRKDVYQDSLRVFDLLLQLALVLCLTVGRLVSFRGVEVGESSSVSIAGISDAGSIMLGSTQFSWQLWQTGLLAVELLALVVVFLHLVPAVIARVWAEPFLLCVFPTVDRIHRLVLPLERFTERLLRAASVLLGKRTERTSADIAEEELLSAAEEGEREGLLQSGDIDMIESILTFGKSEVSEVMTPRTDMVCLDLDASVSENLKAAIACGHSRIPVYRDTKDNVTGLIYVKDLLSYLYRKEEIDLESVIRKPYFVPSTKKCAELLQEFKNHRMHIALVLDEYGGVAGLITIEDILEEIVGEISDEYEEEAAAPIERVSSDLVTVDATVHIDDLNEELHIGVPEDETYDTIGGFLFARMGHVPAQGDVLELDGLRFEVTEADERRVHRVNLHLPGPTTSGAAVPAGDGSQRGGQESTDPAP